MGQQYSAAVEFLNRQQVVRAKNRVKFRKDAKGFLAAHEFALSAVTSCLERFKGRTWSDELDRILVANASQVSQFSSLFLQGVDLCEVAIAEGLYGQAAILIRQHLEILGGIDEVWLGKRNPRSTPKVSSLPLDLRQHYGELSEIGHAAVPEFLHALFTRSSGKLIGSSMEPQYNREIAIFLYRLEIAALLHLASRQNECLTKCYDDGFNMAELEMLKGAIEIANMSAKEFDKVAEPKSS